MTYYAGEFSNLTFLEEQDWEIIFIVFLGAFVPLTMKGNIVVDGVLASCYASFDHDLAHFVMTPM